MNIDPFRPKHLERTLASAGLIALGLAGASLPSLAAPLELHQSPWGLSSDAAPNIIVSVDNSTSMEDTGILMLKNALKAAFSSTNMPDNKIRLAWQAMHGCNAMPNQSGGSLAACNGFNGMRRFSGEHRATFEKWVDSIVKTRGTPTHWVMKNAGDYLSQTNLGVNSPWAFDPGTQEAPLLGCRRAFHILMTDGEYGHSAWGAAGEYDMSGPDGVRVHRGGNADGTRTELPDKTVYEPATAQTRLYTDKWGAATLSSLADLSFHYWSRDLQPGIDNLVPRANTYRSTPENFGTASSPATLEPYWNPRNNPATWQHMVTYTIGFNAAADWRGSPVWANDHFSGIDGLIKGTVTWQNQFCSDKNNAVLPCDGGTLYETRADARRSDLWHTAFNSRGRFIPASGSTALIDAFKNILADINTTGGAGNVSIAGTSGRLASDRLIYEASFDSEKWSGDVIAWGVSASSGARNTTPTWRAATRMEGLTPASRVVYTHNGTRGVVFNWDQLDTAAQTALRGADTTTVGSDRVAYLRGDRTREVAQGGMFRDRESRLGSVVNSNLWVTTAPRRLAAEWAGHATFRNDQAGRPTMVYVGAADGMLHGFDSASGDERIAYVPRALMTELQAHSRPGWAYRAMVDGHPFTGDADLKATAGGDPAWSTVLVSGLGAGGRGFMVLDVTKVSDTSASQVLLDRTASAAMPNTYTGQADVGHLMGMPVIDGLLTLRSEQIVKLNNGRWAAVMGNGINSTNERPVLLIQHLDGDKSLVTLVADSTASAGNGLAPPRLIDVDANGTMDIAYAGDLDGRIWKFNLTSTSDAKWGVAVWDQSGSVCRDRADCQPFARASDPANNAVGQPITTAPAWMPHPMGGIQLMVGTGRLLTSSDATSTSVQTVYALWDKTRYEKGIDAQGIPGLMSRDTARIADANLRNRLVSQPVGAAIAVTDSSGKTHPDLYHQSSSNAVAYSSTIDTAPRGWYVDLPVSGERVLVHPHAFLGRKAIFVTTQPGGGTGDESCDGGTSTGNHWFNVRDMITGAPPTGGVFYAPTVTTSITSATRASVPGNEFLLTPADGNRFTLQMSGSKAAGPNAIIDTVPPPRRAEWRDLRP